MTRYEDINLTRFISFIKDHGIDCYVRDGLIYAEDCYTLNGEAFSSWVVVPPHLADVREFLGY
jgi:hypothetical protein